MNTSPIDSMGLATSTIQLFPSLQEDTTHELQCGESIIFRTDTGFDYLVSVDRGHLEIHSVCYPEHQEDPGITFEYLEGDFSDLDEISTYMESQGYGTVTDFFSWEYWQ